MEVLEKEIKAFVIESLGLEDLAPEHIDTDAALFGDGLGLDSIDALELGVALQKRYGIAISADSEETRRHFASIRSLMQFIAAGRTR